MPCWRASRTVLNVDFFSILCRGRYLGFFLEVSEGDAVHERDGAAVERRRAVDEVALQHEVPRQRHHQRHQQGGCGEYTVGTEAEVVEELPLAQEHAQEGGAVHVEQQAAGPHHQVFNDDGLDALARGVEGEAVVDAAVHHPADKGTDGHREVRAVEGVERREHEGIEQHSRAHVGPRCNLR